jgi:hypothetical protein
MRANWEEAVRLVEGDDGRRATIRRAQQVSKFEQPIARRWKN